MSRLIRLTIKAAVITTLVSLTTACGNFPLPGADQDDNVIESVPQTVEQSSSQTPIQSASQPSTAQTQDNNNQTTAQAPNTAEGENNTTTETAESDSNQPVRALW